MLDKSLQWWMRLTERQWELLDGLEWACRNRASLDGAEKYESRGCAPMECGGSNGSYHSNVLNQLVKKGLVRRRGVGSCRYWITTDGQWVCDHRHEIARRAIRKAKGESS